MADEGVRAGDDADDDTDEDAGDDTRDAADVPGRRPRRGDGETRYINTDLELTSAADLSPLADALVTRGLYAMHPPYRGEDDALWHARFEVNAIADDMFDTPARTVAAMLAAVDSLDATAGALWRGCVSREFDVGYDCGYRPFPFRSNLPNSLLRRVVDAGASIEFTLYPVPPNEPGKR